MDYDLTVKTILIGDSSVGKSSLLYRYTDDDWNPYYIATIGVDFKVKTMERNHKVIKLQLWDTAGQERFRSITQSYYKGAHAVALVFDVNDRESFESLRVWINDVHNFGSANVPVVLIGNKCDLNPKNRMVSTEEAKQFADGLGFRYFETSAKEGTNVAEAFEYIVDKSVEQREKMIVGLRKRNPGGVILPQPSNDDSDPRRGKKTSFCGCN